MKSRFPHRRPVVRDPGDPGAAPRPRRRCHRPEQGRRRLRQRPPLLPVRQRRRR
ncbi:MAG: hypothetical protein M0C28_08190 [Candidatus Moduliflexus flocculans]|nr:hypothetical protein [Candidatus Moduliflexus flocculans]